jgi:hypothetical protein
MIIVRPQVSSSQCVPNATEKVAWPMITKETVRAYFDNQYYRLVGVSLRDYLLLHCETESTA